MSKREIFDCDMCKTQNVPCISELQFWHDSSVNEETAEQTVLHRQPDLCLNCFIKVAKTVLKSWPDIEQKKLAEKLFPNARVV